MVAAAAIGIAGITLIRDSEGLVNKTYLDPVGIVTACYGHTDPKLRLGQTFTDKQCEALLRKDIAKHQIVIQPGHKANCVKHAPLTQNQNDAVVSLVFNIGNGAFCRSTMARKLSARDYPGAANEFPKWVYATSNGRKVKLNGLIKRRENERKLFLKQSTTETVPMSGGWLRPLLGSHG